MSDRPTDHLQPAGKRRLGEQLTKDNVDDDDDEPGYEPGVWGPDSKADEATLKKRKIVRARRGPGGAPANPPVAAAAESSVAAGAAAADGAAAGDVAPANPFAGRSLVAAAAPSPAANPFAGRSLLAPATKADDAAANNDAGGQAEAADKAAGAVVEPAESNGAAAKSELAGQNGDDADKKAAEGGKVESVSVAGPVFGGGTGGFGAFASGGFGGFAGASSGGFGGFGAAAGGSSAFGFGGAGAGSKPLFGAGAAAQAKQGDGEEGSQDGDDKEGGGVEGEGVFGGPEPAPVVTLEEVPKVTGEEAEEVLLTVEGALFEFDAVARSWHERGRGEFRINRNPSTRAARAVMRGRASKRLILNARLYPGMPTSRMAPPQKGVTFAVANVAHTHQGSDAPAADADEAAGSGKRSAAGAGGDAPGAPQLATYALRLKSADAVDSLLAVMDALKEQARAVAGAGSGGAGGSGEEAV